MKLQILATITLALLAAVPGVFSEEPKAGNAKSITSLNGVFDAIANEVANLYDEDEEFDAETGETSVGKKSSKKRSSKKKRSKRKKRSRKRRKYSSKSSSRRSYHYYFDDYYYSSGKSSKDVDEELIKGSEDYSVDDEKYYEKKEEKKKKKSSSSSRSSSEKKKKSSKSGRSSSGDFGKDVDECISLGETAASMIAYEYCGQGSAYSHSKYAKECREVAISQCKGAIYGKVDSACGSPDTSTLNKLMKKCKGQVDYLLGIDEMFVE